MQRRLGNQLIVAASINGRHTALLVDTGSPSTLIDRESVQTLGLIVKNTDLTMGGAFGKRWEHYGVSKLDSLAIGNCTITNVPVKVGDESALNSDSQSTHLAGLFGTREMVLFGMVIDCGHQEIYVSPTGPNAGASQQLGALLQSRGFTRIPLRRNRNKHFDVPATINGRATQLIVDTGFFSTNLEKKFAIDAGVVPGSFGARRTTISDGALRRAALNGMVKELKVGHFAMENVGVMLTPIHDWVLQSKVAGEANAGLLGNEYLSLNFAVIDLGGMNLYLRPPDSGPAKKH